MHVCQAVRTLVRSSITTRHQSCPHTCMLDCMLSGARLCARSFASLCTQACFAMHALCHSQALVLRTSCDAHPCAPCCCCFNTHLLVLLLSLAIQAPDHSLMPFTVGLSSSSCTLGIGMAKASTHANPNI